VGKAARPHPGRQVDLQQRQAGFRHAFSPNGNAFRKALLVQYPREGSWTIAFQTGAPGDIVNHLQGEHVSVYVPTTPNPTSGFFLMMPAKDAIELDMSVDEALKYIISMGVVAPPPHPRAVTNT
jgi:uncharacterized membrane protein